MKTGQYFKNWLIPNQQYYFEYEMLNRVRIFQFSLKEIKLGTRVIARVIRQEEEIKALSAIKLTIFSPKAIGVTHRVDFLAIKEVNKEEAIGLVLINYVIKPNEEAIEFEINLISLAWLHVSHTYRSGVHEDFINEQLNKYFELSKYMNVFGDTDTPIRFCEKLRDNGAVSVIMNSKEATVTLYEDIDHLNFGTFIQLEAYDKYKVIVEQYSSLSYISKGALYQLSYQQLELEWVVHKVTQAGFKRLLELLDYSIPYGIHSLGASSIADVKVILHNVSEKSHIWLSNLLLSQNAPYSNLVRFIYIATEDGSEYSLVDYIFGRKLR